MTWRDWSCHRRIANWVQRKKGCRSNTPPNKITRYSKKARVSAQGYWKCFNFYSVRQPEQLFGIPVEQSAARLFDRAVGIMRLPGWVNIFWSLCNKKERLTFNSFDEDPEPSLFPLPYDDAPNAFTNPLQQNPSASQARTVRFHNTNKTSNNYSPLRCVNIILMIESLLGLHSYALRRDVIAFRLELLFRSWGELWEFFHNNPYCGWNDHHWLVIFRALWRLGWLRTDRTTKNKKCLSGYEFDCSWDFGAGITYRR